MNKRKEALHAVTINRPSHNCQQRFQQIRSNKVFELFVVAIIIFSALIIGIKTYPIPDSLSHLTTVLDWGITVFFLVEIVIRFLAEEQKKTFSNPAGMCLIR
ncbi:ion transporter [Endozoicomonas sp. Mp262]|uniref:ion transporter n=1 Tax=Endozoicomonas sp. Mp262 TaxID=2919499 RepID=UPI0021DB741C